MKRYYYCRLTLDSSKDGLHIVEFPEFKDICTCGNSKEEALVIAKDFLNSILRCLIESGNKITLPINRSEEGLFPIEIDEDVIKSLQVYVDEIKNGFIYKLLKRIERVKNIWSSKRLKH